MPPLAPFPDAERLVAGLLGDLGTTGTETGPGLQDSLPYIRVRRTGGGDDRITDTADVEVAVFDSDATAAKTLAEQIRQVLTAGPARTSYGQLDRARATLGPQTIPATDSATLRLVTATYTISVRR